MKNEDNWENSTNRNMRFLMNDQNIMFGYTPLIKNPKIEKGQSIDFDGCYFFTYPFLLMLYNLFSPNNEISLEQ